MINEALFDQLWKRNEDELGANKEGFMLFICTMFCSAGKITVDRNRNYVFYSCILHVRLMHWGDSITICAVSPRQ
jgi:hypothetical protein